MVRIGPGDLEMLMLLAEFRVASAEQLAVASGGNAEATARRLRRLCRENGFIQMLSQDLRCGPGRPRNLFALTQAGADALGRAGRLSIAQTANIAALPAPRTQPHLIMTNWVWARLRQIVRRAPFLVECHLASDSPLTERTSSGRSVLHDQVALEDGQLIGFEPDGAFCFRHLELGKALLFLLEVDRGTEPRTSPADRPAIGRKLACYQRYYATEGYKTYEKRWGSPFRGFRLLILAETSQRAEAICRLVRQSPPSEFVWTAEYGNLLAQGLHAPIWLAGGDTQLAAQSILGGQYQRVQALIDGTPPGDG